MSNGAPLMYTNTLFTEFEDDNSVFKPNISIANMKEGTEDFLYPPNSTRPKVIPNLIKGLLPNDPDLPKKKLILYVTPVRDICFKTSKPFVCLWPTPQASGTL